MFTPQFFCVKIFLKTLKDCPSKKSKKIKHLFKYLEVYCLIRDSGIFIGKTDNKTKKQWERLKH